MPTSPEAVRLAQVYRAQQAQVRAAYMRDAVALWSVLDKAKVADTSPSWLRLSMALIRRWRGPSGALAVRYYPQARTFDLGSRAGVQRAPRLDTPDLVDEQAVRALLYSGPGEIKRARLRGLDEVQAGRAGLATSAQAGGRLVLEAGRDTLQRAISVDDAAVGYLRVTDGRPCHFCAMLASAGVVYKTRAAAGDDGRGSLNRYHDNCACTVIPVFTTTPTLPAANREYGDLWRTSTRGLSGRDARIAFRRAVEGR